MGTNSISFGECSANSGANTLERQVVEPLKLVVTAIITGYTCQFIYGQRLKNSAIVVPVYKLDVLANNKSVASYNVTRDSWYNRGRIVYNFFSPDEYELSNRCFEPADANINLYSTTPLSYPTSDLDAYALRQKGSELLNAVAHTTKMNTYVDGRHIDDARANLSIAKGVMIHIGGWYNKDGKESLAGSYGCFGIIPRSQIKKN